MKLSKIAGVILIFIFQYSSSMAQSSYEIGGAYLITSEKFASNDAKDIYNDKIFHTFGINGKKIFESNLFLKGGIYLRSFGTKFDVEETTIQIPEGTGEFYEVAWKAKSVNIPINLGFYFLNFNKIRLGVSIGINNNFVLNQSQNVKNVETNIEVYKDYIFDLNANLEIGLKLSSNLILNIVPIWQRQINSNFGEYKQRGFGCQVGISYNLKEK